jgi:membrane-associated protease RseP (regulator of RpoE activity)
MDVSRYLRPGRGLLAVALSLALLGTFGSAWAQSREDDDASDDKDKKEIRVYRSGDDDENGEEGNTFQYRVERADAKGGYLGVRVQDITRSLMKARDLPTDEGALVNRVEDDSPADNAGMRRGDVIVEVNRDKVANSNELVDAVRDLKPGSKVDVVVLRDGARKTLRVEVAKRPHDMMMGTPEWRGDGGMDPKQMRELRTRLREMDPKGMDGDLKGMGPGPQFRQEMDELRQELDNLKEELQELKRELHERNQSDD